LNASGVLDAAGDQADWHEWKQQRELDQAPHEAHDAGRGHQSSTSQSQPGHGLVQTQLSACLADGLLQHRVVVGAVEGAAGKATSKCACCHTGRDEQPSSEATQGAEISIPAPLDGLDAGATRLVTSSAKKRPPKRTTSGAPSSRARESTARAQQKIETLQKVTEAARELFTEHGFEGTTTDAIAEHAGVAKGTLFFHAKDKLDLLMLVMHDDLKATSERCLEHIPKTAPLLKQVTFIFNELIAMYLASPLRSKGFLTRIFLANGPHSQRLHALTLGFLIQVATLISAAEARGEVRAGTPAQLAASNMFSAYVMTLLAWATGQISAKAVKPMVSQAIELQVRGLSA
jgi:TetR/AcrR family transcriptional regulator, cholesterol catabolism regulator